MRRFTLLKLGVVLVVALSSFLTGKRTVNVYMVYKGTGPQKDITQYNQATSQPSAHFGSDVLYWFKIVDADGYISQMDFVAAFENLDVNQTASDNLDDEDEIPGVLEKKWVD